MCLESTQMRIKNMFCMQFNVYKTQWKKAIATGWHTAVVEEAEVISEVHQEVFWLPSVDLKLPHLFVQMVNLSLDYMACCVANKVLSSLWQPKKSSFSSGWNFNLVLKDRKGTNSFSNLALAYYNWRLSAHMLVCSITVWWVEVFSLGVFGCFVSGVFVCLFFKIKHTQKRDPPSSLYIWVLWSF